MVKAEDGSRSRGRGFESRRIIDGKLLQCNLKDELEKIKVAKWGKPPKKYLKKILCVGTCNIPICLKQYDA